MKDTKKRLKFEEGLKTIVGGFCWSQDGGDGGYDFGDIVKYIDKATQEARADERARVRKIIEESRWECYEHGLPNYEKTDCVECNSALETNVVLEALLASLDKSVTKKE